MLAKAISITAQAFENKKDKGGKPSIMHSLRVMHGVDQEDEELMCIAVMHDLKEEFPDIWDMYAHLFSPRICQGIDSITRRADETYRFYIEDRVSKNKDSIMVKLKDIHDNCDPRRLALLDNSASLIKRYTKARLYLSKQI